MIWGVRYLIFLLAVSLCASAQEKTQKVYYRNPVMAGDHPDPSIIRVGNDFWATSTASEWGPEFQLLHSTDLVNWEVKGAVLPHTPSWASGNFWAPEISEFENRFYVYYAGRIKGGPLAVAVAIADHPEGPYHDHGPFIAQEDGSIDPAPATDENGRRYLIWKEDGNSRNLPSTIWAQQLDSSGAGVVGRPTALIFSDTDWEGKVVEGPFILRRGNWFYLFYSGAGCCGRNCNYAVGVARSHALLGPWMKNPANPILAANDVWKCPGHGSIVTDQRGRYWFLYHGYSTNGFVFTGRQALLDEVKFGSDGWPTINNGKGPTIEGLSPFGAEQRRQADFREDFSHGKLAAGWQWDQANEPNYRIHDGCLELATSESSQTNLPGAVLARLVTSPDFRATTVIKTGAEELKGMAGLVLLGDSENAIGVSVGDGEIVAWRMRRGEFTRLQQQKLRAGTEVELRLTAHGASAVGFAVKEAGGDWQTFGGQVDGSELPPWDRGMRIGLSAGGSEKARGRFRRLEILMHPDD